MSDQADRSALFSTNPFDLQVMAFKLVCDHMVAAEKAKKAERQFRRRLSADDFIDFTIDMQRQNNERIKRAFRGRTPSGIIYDEIGTVDCAGNTHALGIPITNPDFDPSLQEVFRRSYDHPIREYAYAAAMTGIIYLAFAAWEFVTSIL